MGLIFSRFPSKAFLLCSSAVAGAAGPQRAGAGGWWVLQLLLTVVSEWYVFRVWESVSGAV